MIFEIFYILDIIHRPLIFTLQRLFALLYSPQIFTFLFNIEITFSLLDDTRCHRSWRSPCCARPSPSPTSSTWPPSTGCSARASTSSSRSISFLAHNQSLGAFDHNDTLPCGVTQRPLLLSPQPPQPTFQPGPVPPLPGLHQVQALPPLRPGRPRRQHLHLVGGSSLPGGEPHLHKPGQICWFELADS